MSFTFAPAQLFKYIDNCLRSTLNHL